MATIQHRGTMPWRIMSIWKQIQRLLSLILQRASQFCTRQNSTVAHLLAHDRTITIFSTDLPLHTTAHVWHQRLGHKLPFFPSTTVSSKQLELVHSDVWGLPLLLLLVISDITWYLLMIFQNILGCFHWLLNLIFSLYFCTSNFALKTCLIFELNV